MDGHTDSMKARTHSKHLTCFLKRISQFNWLNTHQKALRSASAPPLLHYSDPATKPLCSRSAWLDWAKRNKKLRDWADTRSVLQVLWNLLLQIKSSATLNTLNWGQYHDVCRSCKETGGDISRAGVTGRLHVMAFQIWHLQRRRGSIKWMRHWQLSLSVRLGLTSCCSVALIGAKTKWFTVQATWRRANLCVCFHYVLTSLLKCVSVCY